MKTSITELRTLICAWLLFVFIFGCADCPPAPLTYGVPWNGDYLAEKRLQGDNRLSYRFRASHSGRACCLLLFMPWKIGYLRCGSGTFPTDCSDAGTLHVELREDDGTPEHLPKLAAIAETEMNLPTRGLPISEKCARLIGWDRLPNAFTVVTIPNDWPEVVEGKLYHLVFSNSHPSSETHWSSINNLHTQVAQEQRQPAVPNEDLAVLFSDVDGSDWHEQFTDTPIFGFWFEGGGAGVVQGQGYREIKSASYRMALVGPGVETDCGEQFGDAIITTPTVRACVSVDTIFCATLGCAIPECDTIRRDTCYMEHPPAPLFQLQFHDSIAEYFKVTGESRCASSVNIRLSRHGNPNPLVIGLWDLTDHSLIRAVEMHALDVPGSQANWVSAKLNPPITLESGKKYELLLTTSNRSNVLENHFQIYPLVDGRNLGFGGTFTDGYFRFYRDGAVIDELPGSNARMIYDLPFYFSVTMSECR